MGRAKLSFILLCPLGLALPSTSQTCALRLNVRGKPRAVFTDTGTGEVYMGHRLTCVCNSTTRRGGAPRWLDRNGVVLPELNKTEVVDYKVTRGKAHLRIKKGFSCADAGEYTCVFKGSRRTVFVTPKDVKCPPKDQCVRDDEVCKGANNPLQYRVVTLPNELRVLLISNNKTSTAGAAMDVHSGFFQDTLPGMAHFCEHMLFLGTEKYPEEGSYSQFLTSNGGTWNAFTRSEYTIYFFSVNSEKLTEAADIFAQFFIAPLFTESAVNREINAVNSEFELTKGVPDWYFISIMNDVADPKSEYSRFVIGNSETLDVPGIRDKVIEYYQSRYSANLMQLVLYGKEDVDELERWAREIFYNVSNRGLLPPQPPNSPYPAGYSPRLIVFKPLGPTPQLVIVFQTPSQQELHRYGVANFIARLFAYEGKGSASHYLKNTHSWATAVSFFALPFSTTSGFDLYGFGIGLTEAGVANIEDVVAGVFGYIEMLKGSDDEELYAIWEGRNTLDRINFNNAPPPSDIAAYVRDLAVTMRTVEHPADFLSPPQRALWDINLVRSFLSYLSPDNSNVVFANPALVYDNQTSLPSAINCTDPRATRHNFNVSSADRLTPYFDSIYAVYCTDPTLIQKWENPGIPEGTFFLPEFQRYAPQDLALLPLPPEHSTVPQLVLDNSAGYRVWWMQDYQFRDPVVIVRCQAYTGAVAATARDRALSTLYQRYVTELLTEVTDVASVASYHMNFGVTRTGIRLEFSGYSDPAVVMRFITDVLNGVSNTSEESFRSNPGTLALAYQFIVDTLKNYETSTVPFQYVLELSRLMLLDPRYLHSEALEVFNNITVNDLPAVLAQHIKNVLNSISRMECYVTGNVDRDRAIVYSGTIREALLKGSTTGEGQEGDVRVVKLKQGTTALTTRTLNPQADDNSAIFVVKQVGPACDVTDDPKDGSSVTCSDESLENTVFSNVLSLIISNACFTTLRTQEQLGYVVSCGALPYDEVLSIIFVIQSPLRAPPFLLDRINNFTRTFYATAVLNPAFFSQGLEALKTILRADSKNIQEEVNRLWAPIHNQRYNFDFRENLLNAADSVTHARFVDFYNTYLIGKQGVENQTSIRELVVGAFSADVATASFDVPRQVKAEDQYESVREFKKVAKYWEQ